MERAARVGEMAVSQSAEWQRELRTTARLGHRTWDFAGEGTLPLLDACEHLEPHGIKRGVTIGLDRQCHTLAGVLAAGPSQSGEWVAIVGVEDMGFEAAAAMGLALQRCVWVPRPGAQWATAVGALLEVTSIVIASPAPTGVRFDARRLRAVARERRSALVALGDWMPGPDVRWSIASSCWSGLGTGFGALTTRRLTVRATGRGRHELPREVELVVPDIDGAARVSEQPQNQRPQSQRPQNQRPQNQQSQKQRSQTQGPAHLTRVDHAQAV